jgi:hypothetical protein
MKGESEEARRMLLAVREATRQRGDLQMMLNLNMELAWLFLTQSRSEQVQDWSEVEV